MSDLIEEVVRSVGPCLTSDLSRILVEKHGLTAMLARKRVSRRSTAVRTLKGLKFLRNARFIYLQEQYGSPRFWSALIEALTHSPAYSGALACVIERGGVLPREHFFIACGSPVAQKGHLSSDQVLTRLTEAKLLEEIEVPGVGVCVALANRAEYRAERIATMKARLVIERIVLQAVRMWARNLALGSYDRFILRDDGDAPPRVGTFLWDLTAPSYVGALVTWKTDGPKSGFLVCDVLLGSPLSLAGLRPFIHKCTTLRQLKRVGRTMQLFIADGYSSEAWMLAPTRI